MSALKGKQERFCQEYIIDYIGKRAAIRAGYSEDSAKQQAYRLLQRDDVRERIRQLQEEQVKRLAVSQDFVVTQMVDVYQCCREDHPKMVWNYETHEMEESGKYTFDARGALKALEMIGKHFGMFEKKGKNKEESGAKLEDLI